MRTARTDGACSPQPAPCGGRRARHRLYGRRRRRHQHRPDEQRRTTPRPATPSRIGFSGPAADHGWLGAINSAAIAEAEKYDDVELDRRRGHERRQPADQPGRDLHQRRRRRHRAAADRRRRADRGRDQGDGGRHPGHQRRPRVLAAPSPHASPSSVTTTAWASAPAPTSARSSATTPTPSSRRSPASTRCRSRRTAVAGFADALERLRPRGEQPRRRRLHRRRAARPWHRSCSSAAPQIDAIWNHDDDQGVGVLAAIDAAGRDEFFMVGGAGSKNAMEAIKAGDTVLEATVIYPSTQAADGIAPRAPHRAGQGAERPRRAGRAERASCSTHRS